MNKEIKYHIRRIVIGIILITIFYIISIFTVQATTQCTNNYCNDFTLKPSISESTENYINTLIINPTANNDAKGQLYYKSKVLPQIGGGYIKSEPQIAETAKIVNYSFCLLGGIFFYMFIMMIAKKKQEEEKKVVEE